MTKARKRRKSNGRRTLLLIVPIVLATSILVIYYVHIQPSPTPSSNRTSNGDFIPLYVDASNYKIDMSSVSLIISEAVENGKKEIINLIAFGSHTCPHCQNLHQLFEKHFKDRYIFLWINEPSSAALFRKLAQIEQNNGVPLNYAYSVPQTIVVKDGKPVAIVVGGILDVAFWQDLLS
ncbi:MAG: thioredoxin family protein [Ignisphaera sp.]|nr:thioredoxin family protein [Ignisphaera sp.]MCX8168438.1 thioredoxin family protein [Ignisphaera sp.]MDW8086049.1 thioredoxin family protein [Ignisphaera sp.]